MSRVLITGGSGFIGKEVVKQLSLEKDLEVHVTTNTRAIANPSITNHRINLLHSEAATKLISELKPTHLLHLAWDVTHGKYWAAPSNIEWSAATLHLFHEFQKNGGKRFVGAGTCAEYDWTAPVLKESVTPCDAASLYGQVKNKTREILEVSANALQVEFCWGRIFFLYGPEEHPERLVPSVIRSLLQGKEALSTTGLQQRDFMHVHDAASAFVSLLKSDVQGAVNVASGVCVPIKEIVQLIGELTGRTDLLRIGALKGRPGDPERLEADVTKLFHNAHFRPAYTLQTGLRDVISWWKEHLAKVTAS